MYIKEKEEKREAVAERNIYSIQSRVQYKYKSVIKIQLYFSHVL